MQGAFKMPSIARKLALLVVAFLTIGGIAAAQEFSAIEDCNALYSSEKTDQTTKSNLKHIDVLLTNQMIDNAKFQQAIARFISACRRLGGDLTQTGPKMDDMIDALHGLEQAKGPVYRRYHALQVDPELTLFNSTAARAARDYHQPACFSNINNRTVDILSESQELLDKADINCADPP